MRGKATKGGGMQLFIGSNCALDKVHAVCLSMAHTSTPFRKILQKYKSDNP